MAVDDDITKVTCTIL